MLNAIISITSGAAKVGGFDVVTQNIDVKTICGFLPESPGLYQKLTAKEFLEFIGEKNFSVQFDRFRKIRNKINYYGKDISVEEVKEYSEKIELLIKKLKLLIKKRLK